MGYYYHLASMPIQTVKELENLRLEELNRYIQQKHPYAYHAETSRCDLFALMYHRLYMWKSSGWVSFAEIYKTGKPLFNRLETQQYYAYFQPFIVGQQGVRYAMEECRKKIIKNYERALYSDPSFDWNKQYVRQHMRYWKENRVLNFRKDGHFCERMTSLMHEEYSVFDYARVFWDVDWDRETLIIYGE